MRYLLVDDDEVFRSRMARAFRARGFAVAESASFEGALAVAGEFQPTKAVVDLKMPGISGLQLLRALKERNAELEVVLLTGYGSIATAIEAMRLGARNYLTKPCDVDAIVASFSPELPHHGENNVKLPSLPEMEWEYIQRVLADCNGNLSLAAKKLGLHRRSLQRKLLKAPN